MKKTFLLLIALSTFLFSCEEKQVAENYNTTILGQIENYDGIEKEVEYTVNRIGFYIFSSSAIDSEGKFKIQYNSTYPYEVKLTFQRQITLVTNPSDTVYLKIDNKQFKNDKNYCDGIAISGKNAELNNMLIKYSDIEMSTIDTLKMDLHISRYTPLEFIDYQKMLRTERISKLSTFIEKETPNAEFIDCANTSIHMEYYIQLMRYKFQFNRINERKDEKTIPNDYLQIIDSLEIGFDDLKSGKTSQALSLYVYHLKKPSSEILKLPQSEFQNLLLCYYVYNEIHNYDFKFYETNKSQIFELLGENPFFKQIEQTYAKNKEFVEKPFKEGSVKFISKPQMKGEDVYKEVLKIGKNKVIYLDCWGTWCGGCIQDFPYANRLKARFKDKNVCFIYLCFNSKEKEWKKVINKERLSGTHFLLTCKQSRYFENNFFPRRRSYPNYIIIDKNADVQYMGPEYRAVNYKTASIIDDLLNE